MSHTAQHLSGDVDDEMEQQQQQQQQNGQNSSSNVQSSERTSSQSNGPVCRAQNVFVSSSTLRNSPLLYHPEVFTFLAHRFAVSSFFFRSSATKMKRVPWRLWNALKYNSKTFFANCVVDRPRITAIAIKKPATKRRKRTMIMMMTKKVSIMIVEATIAMTTIATSRHRNIAWKPPTRSITARRDGAFSENWLPVVVDEP